jgi:diguanylate cyclase (GGDEF)-like protein
VQEVGLNFDATLSNPQLQHIIRSDSLFTSKKERSLKWLLAIAILTFFSYSFINLFLFSFISMGIVELIFGIIFMVLYYFSQFPRWHDTISMTIALLSGFLLWGLSALASYNDHSIMIWIGLFPLIAFYLLGVHNGLIAHTIFSLSIFFFLYWKSSADPTSFNIIDLTNIGGALIAFGIVASLFELNRSEALKEALTRSMLDELTGAGSRKLLHLILSQVQSHSKRHHTPTSLLIIDVDHFKQVNDTYGHLIGDEVLKAFATLLNTNIRQKDTLIRWGGEEFMIIIPDADRTHTAALAEKLRQTIEQHDFETIGHITASFGVTQIDPNESEEAIIKRADTALYRAKENGRNRVEDI